MQRTIIRPPASGGSSAKIYNLQKPFTPELQTARLTEFCVWADAQDFNPVEFLLPVLEIEDEEIGPYAFERRAAGIAPPSPAEIEQHLPWHYQIEFSDTVSTRGYRFADEWGYHHHRAATLVELIDRIYGDARGGASVLDVGCHCGVMALEFAARGFGDVRGVDLRRDNISRAQFLAEHFKLPNASFKQLNARDLHGEAPANVVFCGGLLYHVTFPHELVQSLAALTQDILVLDTMCQRHPFSGFHYLGGKDVFLSIEGETAVEFVPTYRGVIDLLHAAGFTQVYEVLGARRHETPLYQTNNIRSFVAAREDCTRLRGYVEGLNQGAAVADVR